MKQISGLRAQGAGVRAWGLLLALGAVAAGCHTDMWRQPRLDPQDESPLFPDGASARPLVQGTIPRGHLREDNAFFTGISNGKWVETIPAQGAKEDLRAFIKRGQERFNIFCSPCHGRLGDGQGMIANRGLTLRRPVGNYHTDRLRKMPVGHFYDVITNGYGAMYSYASRVQEPEDRWAIVAYIRALQLSQNASAAEVDLKDLRQLRAQPGTATAPGDSVPVSPTTQGGPAPR